MIPASVLTQLATLGLSDPQVSAVASMLAKVEEATEQKVGAELEARRASDRARKQKQRELSRDFTGRHVTSGTDETGVSSRARVLPWEDSKYIPPDDPNGSSTPKGAGVPEKSRSQNRGNRLPDDWQPKPEHLELALSLALGRDRYQRAVDEFRDYWRGVPGTRGTKLDWDATFRNRLRDIAERETRPQARSGQQRSSGDGMTVVLQKMREQVNGQSSSGIKDISPTPRSGAGSRRPWFTLI
jgi:hypothetical protein